MARYFGDWSRFGPLLNKVLPLVYDESLSYYEQLCKVLRYVEEHEELIREFIEEYDLPEISPSDNGKVLGVDENGKWVLIDIGTPTGTREITENGIVDVKNFEYADVQVPQGITPVGVITITSNGTIDVTEYASAVVSVPASAVDVGSKAIGTNGTHDVIGYASAVVNVPASQVDSGTKNIGTNGNHDVVGYANANVNVPASEVDSGTKSVTSNGLHDVTGYANVDVDVPSGGVTPTGTVNINTNGTHNVTQYANANVNVPASEVDTGTKAIATNGTHDVVGYAAVNVNVSAGGVDVGTKNINTNGLHDVVGYANANVNVPASEVDAGTKQITANGASQDVTGYKYVDVNVPASAVDAGTKQITSNGTHDVVGYANASVAVKANFTLVRHVALSIYISYDTEPSTITVWYRGYDPSNPQNVIWKTQEIVADGTPQNIEIAVSPTADGLIYDGFYIQGWDGVTPASYTCVNCFVGYQTSGEETGSEKEYIVVTNDNASVVATYA